MKEPVARAQPPPAARLWRADPPPTSDEILSRAVGWGSAAGAAVVLTCAIGYLTVSRLMDRRRIAQWARAWLRTAPRWTART